VPISPSIARALGHRVAIEQPPARRQRAKTEILGHRKVLAERELLVHHADAGSQRIARALEVSLAAVDEQPAGVGLVDAGEELPQRALARAILAA
jgi:hypothetical protein